MSASAILNIRLFRSWRKVLHLCSCKFSSGFLMCSRLYLFSNSNLPFLLSMSWRDRRSGALHGGAGCVLEHRASDRAALKAHSRTQQDIRKIIQKFRPLCHPKSLGAPPAISPRALLSRSNPVSSAPLRNLHSFYS
jgi:hypothetical protein